MLKGGAVGGEALYAILLGFHPGKGGGVITVYLVFCNGTGRTGLPNGDAVKLFHSIHNRLFIFRLFIFPAIWKFIPAMARKRSWGKKKRRAFGAAFGD